MPKTNQHLNQWRHNRSLLTHIPREYPDWLVTVTFYSALHMVDALLDQDAIRVTNHDARLSVLRDTNRYKQINRHYYPLYSLCRTVRYFADPSRWITADDIEREVFRRYLYPIEKSVGHLLGETFDEGSIVLTQVTP